MICFEKDIPQIFNCSKCKSLSYLLLDSIIESNDNPIYMCGQCGNEDIAKMCSTSKEAIEIMKKHPEIKIIIWDDKN